eukprot:869800_1
MKSTLILLTITFLFAFPVLGALRGGDIMSKYADEATTYDPTHDTEEKDLTETAGSDKEMTPGKDSNKPAVDKTGKTAVDQPAKEVDWVQHLFVVVGGLIAAYLIAMYVWKTIKCVAWILFIILAIVFILYAMNHSPSETVAAALNPKAAGTKFVDEASSHITNLVYKHGEDAIKYVVRESLALNSENSQQ